MKNRKLPRDAFLWALQEICALHRKPFSVELALQQFAAPYTSESLLCAAQAYGFDTAMRKATAAKLHKESFPIVAWLGSRPASAITDDRQDTAAEAAPTECEEVAEERVIPALVLQANVSYFLIIESDDTAPRTVSIAEFGTRYLGHITCVIPKAESATDPDCDTEARHSRKFGFSWFIPELLKYKRLWQEVLLASLVIQLIALATPLFTQAIVDKVVVHRTQSTLIVIAIGMALFMLFSAGLSWVRQYLILHTGNRVDAVLGSSVFERLFKLPPSYFQHRPTGVIAARLQGVETIREFIASAAVT
ncbi:MAG: ABC transporter transmembrane domain-containing protein, partial [Noviherbaspirillum sp.]